LRSEVTLCAFQQPAHPVKVFFGGNREWLDQRLGNARPRLVRRRQHKRVDDARGFDSFETERAGKLVDRLIAFSGHGAPSLVSVRQCVPLEAI
jgi:hypothetical protein